MEQATKESDPIPMIGGPHDGDTCRYTIIFPFLNGGVASEIVDFGDFYYRLRKDRSAWEFGGFKKKEPQ